MKVSNSLSDTNTLEPSSKNATISICIPARNEEQNIGSCLDSILEHNCINILEIIVLDDQSEDQTVQEVIKRISRDERIQLISSKPLAAGWGGKNWACHQLSQKARGEYLIFLDADVRINSKKVFNLSVFHSLGSTALCSFWPDQHINGFWQKIVIPWVYRALLTHLPSKYQHQKPLLMPQFIYTKIKPMFAAANGQCMIFKAELYHEVGGHEAVKSEVVEDIELSRLVLKNGHDCKILNGHGLISCKMYESHNEMWNGFRKNFFAGFNYSTFSFVMAGIFHLCFFVLPLFLVFSPPFTFLSLSVIGLSIVTDLRLRNAYKWPIFFALFHTVGVLWFSFLSLACLTDYYFKRQVQWKGRSL